MTERICQVCGTPIVGRRADAKYCGRPCSIRAAAATRSGRTDAGELRRRYQAAWLERSGRSSVNRDPNKVCPQCGMGGVNYQWTHCSRECARAARPKVQRNCCECLEAIDGSAKFCDDCRSAAVETRRLAARGQLLAAFEDDDWPVVVAQLLHRATPERDCMVWSGQQRNGYGRVRVGRRTLLPHRLMYQAANGGADLGHMPVHHKCGNSMCINPDHLQVVTPHENTAEMLERNAYLSRIADLEEALSEVSPNHKLLRTRNRQLRLIA